MPQNAYLGAPMGFQFPDELPSWARNMGVTKQGARTFWPGVETPGVAPEGAIPARETISSMPESAAGVWGQHYSLLDRLRGLRTPSQEGYDPAQNAQLAPPIDVETHRASRPGFFGANSMGVNPLLAPQPAMPSFTRPSPVPWATALQSPIYSSFMGQRPGFDQSAYTRQRWQALQQQYSPAALSNLYQEYLMSQNPFLMGY